MYTDKQFAKLSALHLAALERIDALEHIMKIRQEEVDKLRDELAASRSYASQLEIMNQA